MTAAEVEAEQFIADFGLSLPVNPEEVCGQISTDELQIDYNEEKFESSDICGLSIGHGNKIHVVINSGISNPGRKNFTGAHEIGHVVLHIQKGIQSEFTCTHNDLGGRNNANRSYEKAANEFASSLLMPKCLIGNTISRNDITWGLIHKLSKECETSLEATARRVVSISNEMCALVIHKNKQMWTPIRSPSFYKYIDSIPFPRHLESQVDTVGSLYLDCLNECDSSDWIRDTKNIPDTILYQSILNSEYDRQMTLLVVPEVDDEEEDVWERPAFR